MLFGICPRWSVTIGAWTELIRTGYSLEEFSFFRGFVWRILIHVTFRWFCFTHWFSIGSFCQCVWRAWDLLYQLGLSELLLCKGPTSGVFLPTSLLGRVGSERFKLRAVCRVPVMFLSTDLFVSFLWSRVSADSSTVCSRSCLFHRFHDLCSRFYQYKQSIFLLRASVLERNCS